MSAPLGDGARPGGPDPVAPSTALRAVPLRPRGRRARSAAPPPPNGEGGEAGRRRSRHAGGRSIAALALLLALAAPATAVQPDEVLSDPVLEARARSISEGLRCLVCQNQSIDDSAAPLARDLRLIVREHLVAGDSDDAIRAYLVERYGDFVLLRPPVEGATMLLWGTPVLVILLGGVALLKRRRAPEAPRPLSPDEQARLEALLADRRG